MEPWINFKKLRESISFTQILEHYNVAITKKGQQIIGNCPLPNHGEHRKKESFSANVEKGVFRCFQCGAKGNLLDFATLMAGRDPEDGQELRKTALELQEKFGKPEIVQPKPHEEKRLSQVEENKEKVLINPPLDFELKDLDPDHWYLKERRHLNKATIELFGLGFCNRAWLKGRIAIPLQDSEGKLVGYAGRLIEDDPNTPKYMFPGERERKGFVHKFQKSLFLYNGHRIKAPVNDLCIVEGFPSVWWFHQNGFPNTVACMGDSWSAEQIKLVLDYLHPKGRAWVFADGDFAGRRAAGLFVQQIVTQRLTRLIELPDGKQPTDIIASELNGILSN